MKKILFLLLLSVAMYGQVPADATPLENIQITNNKTSTTATKVNVQENDGTINTKPLSELANYVEFASAVNLPVTGEQGKLYLTKDNNRLYRFNGTIYQELTTDETTPAGLYQPLENQRLSTSDSPHFPNISLNNEVGNSVFTQYKIGGNNRFILGLDGTAESGINIGSNYAFYRYNNDGSYIGRIFSINRSTGIFDFSEVNPTIFDNQIVSNDGGTWGINISGTAASSNAWNGLQFVGDEQPVGAYSIGYGADGKFHFATAQAYKNWLGLGSNAYTSTAYLPLSGGTLSGNITATAFFQSSDRRLKTILKRDGDVAYFKWKDGRDNKQHIGYIAQEVQENHPNQVQADDKGILSVNYVEILVEKIRVLEKRIDQLEKSK